MTDQAQLLRNLVNQTASYIPRTVAVTSGKGGVGKTIIAINLALALINLKQKVALLDGDLGLANADLLWASTQNTLWLILSTETRAPRYYH